MINLEPTPSPWGVVSVEALREATSPDRGARQAAAVEGQRTAGSHIDLSDAGLALSKSTQGKNADIDNSDLPDIIKDALKRIREIRTQLEKKLQELSAATSDRKLTEDQRKARIQGLQSEVAALSAALADASTALTKLMNESAVTPEQAMAVGQLLMA